MIKNAKRLLGRAKNIADIFRPGPVGPKSESHQECSGDMTDNVDEMERLSRELTMKLNEINDKIRQLRSREGVLPNIYGFDKKSKISICVLEEKTPWAGTVVNDCKIPAMISMEEKQYYKWLGQFYSGEGEVVELGPWLGCSTFYILEGLKDNPCFNDKKLHVYDDFVWRSDWMDKYVPESLRPQNRGDFRHLFEMYTGSFNAQMSVEKRKICTYHDNKDLPQLAWGEKPVEIMYVDCGRTFEVNEQWYKIFSGAFIPNRTIIVMQDWRVHREVPVKWINQTKLFTDSKGLVLQQIHELKNGHVATFLYRGK